MPEGLQGVVNDSQQQDPRSIPSEESNKPKIDLRKQGCVADQVACAWNQGKVEDPWSSDRATDQHYHLLQNRRAG